MFSIVSAFGGISVKDLDAAKEFYTRTLGLELGNEDMGLSVALPGGGQLFVYQKDDHVPATFTVLNLVVDDIDAAVEELEQKGIKFEHYDLGNGAAPDEKGILRGKKAKMGPDIAWFKDPSGNVLSVLEE